LSSLWRRASAGGAYLKEVILENFMSYEYARIPLKPGLNLICGPNGAGKSTVLVAISVALGQTYTERSRRLADLVRWGKEIARVSLVLDNRSVNGRRPIPLGKSDTFMLSRYIRRDGSYWFEADFREVGKQEVVATLQKAGLNPDNMIVVMHQGMIEEFLIISPQEKLRMVEEAVGFSGYRESIREARIRLEQTVSEEEQLTKLLQEADENLRHWRNMYERWLERNRLRGERALLQGELLWAKVAREEERLATLRERVKARVDQLARLQDRLAQESRRLEEARSTLGSTLVEERKLFATLSQREKEVGRLEAQLEVALRASSMLSDGGRIIEGALAGLPDETAARLRLKLKAIDEYSARLQSLGGDARGRLSAAEEEVRRIQGSLAEAQRRLDAAIERYAGTAAQVAVMEFQRGELEKSISHLKMKIAGREAAINGLVAQASSLTPRPDKARSLREVLQDLRSVEARLTAYEDVPEDAETLYRQYEQGYSRIRERLGEVAESKRQLLRELDKRKEVWRSSIMKLIEEVNPKFQAILSAVNGTGEVQFVEGSEVEDAGLELKVGFRGAEPVPLNAFTQSGGEKSAAVVSFLLALQESIVSPFRAIDEFDTHLDPQNRESLFRVIYERAKRGTDQWLVITPGQILVPDQEVNIILVQAVRGASAPKVLA
jgi:chromosome segregation ATPase